MIRRVKRLAGYLILPILFVLAAFLLLGQAFAPVLEYLEGMRLQMVTEGAPGYSRIYEPGLLTEYGKDYGNGEVREPSYGTRYGEIICETAALRAPVYYGDDEELLNKGVGQYIGSKMPGSRGVVLIGGHDVIYFDSLGDMAVGDEVELRTTYGTFRYEVTGFAVAGKDDSTAYDLEAEGEYLILYTCYPFGGLWTERKDRYFVYCVGRD